MEMMKKIFAVVAFAASVGGNVVFAAAVKSGTDFVGPTLTRIKTKLALMKSDLKDLLLFCKEHPRESATAFMKGAFLGAGIDVLILYPLIALTGIAYHSHYGESLCDTGCFGSPCVRQWFCNMVNGLASNGTRIM